MPKAAQKRPQPKNRLAKLIRRTPPKAAIVARPTVAEGIEKVLLEGNLAPLTTEQRLEYYRAVCKSLGLNPLTKPFAYINLQGKITLYALRDCTEQLRKIHGVSVTKSIRKTESDLAVVEVEVRNREGRTDTGTGAVPIYNVKGEALANALMKAETKAKRRATLSICGLGFLDESELDTMSGKFNMLTPGGRIIDEQAQIPESEQRYLDREKEQIDQLTPAQKEVVTRRMAEAEARKNTPIDIQPPREAAPEMKPCLFWQHHKESDTWEIFGSDELKKQNRDLLAPLYSPVAKAIVCSAKQLGALINQLEMRHVSIREYGAQREPGE